MVKRNRERGYGLRQKRGEMVACGESKRRLTTIRKSEVQIWRKVLLFLLPDYSLKKGRRLKNNNKGRGINKVGQGVK